MAFQAGRRFGPYEILSPLGVGGMGEVYRARDTKLNREVAVKVLLPAIANDPDRLARFSREAQVLASLNHPNIAAIYGVEDSGDVRALVMELAEGPTLADLIASAGAPHLGLTIADALAIARQIADALEAAHEQGIVHRDLKPGNIKVREDGTVKVLDFGLAKAMDATSSKASAAMSPTISMHATQAGIILGTAAYMSPEQAVGKPVDKRSDLWAFGVVLLEMLTGRQVFAGETVSDVLASVLKDEPSWATLPPSTPAPIRRLLRRCLEKDRKRRLDSASAARLEIEDALTVPASDSVANPASGTAVASRRASLLPWAIAAATLAVAAGALASRRVDREPPMPVYSSVDLPADSVLGEDDALVNLPTRTPMVFTPDGRSLVIQAAHAGKPQLFLRSLDHPDPRPIAGTDDARVPFVSPDGKWVGFWAANELRKVPIGGGAATTICPLIGALGPNGAMWGTGDVIVFGDDQSGNIMRVSANGGTPVAVTTPPPASRRRHVTPFLLPDGKRLLFADVSTYDANDARLMVQSLDGGNARLVVAAATDGRLLSSGQLAFMRLGTLMTVRFDQARAEATGEAVAALTGVMQSALRARNGALNTGAGMFAVSSFGTLAVVRGGLIAADRDRLIWATRDGRFSAAEPLIGAPTGHRTQTRISPDGSRATVVVWTSTRRQLWLVDWTRNLWTSCDGCGETGSVVWSSDGPRLLVTQNGSLVAHTLDGSAPDKVLVHEGNRLLLPTSWLADGRIVYQSSPDQTNYEIKLLEPGGSAGRVIVPLGMGTGASVSPNGHWLAYTKGQTGQTDVFVQAFPDSTVHKQVSAGGGQNPVWSADSNKLYYIDNLGSDRSGTTFYAVDITAAGGLTVGTPRELFRRSDRQGCNPVRCYDVSADGQRFLFHDLSAVKRESVTRIDLVLNWTEPHATGQ